MVPSSRIPGRWRSLTPTGHFNSQAHLCAVVRHLSLDVGNCMEANVLAPSKTFKAKPTIFNSLTFPCLFAQKRTQA